jgi:hypothetical protein
VTHSVNNPIGPLFDQHDVGKVTLVNLLKVHAQRSAE